MAKSIVETAILISIAIGLGVSSFADAPSKASTCVACHGQKGLSVNDQWPNLQSQKKAYLIQQLKDFRDGTRSNALMTPVARMLSDQDILELSTYFSEGAQ